MIFTPFSPKNGAPEKMRVIGVQFLKSGLRGTSQMECVGGAQMHCRRQCRVSLADPRQDMGGQWQPLERVCRTIAFKLL